MSAWGGIGTNNLPILLHVDGYILWCNRQIKHTYKHKHKCIANIARARWTRLAKNDLLDKLEDMEDGSCSIFQGRTLYWHISNNTTFLSDIPDFQQQPKG